MSYVTIVTKDCMMCKRGGTLTVWEDDYKRYLAGAYVQEAFPDLLAPAREQIMTGIHPECWAKIFGDDNED